MKGLNKLTDNFRQKLSSILEKVDDRVLQAKINNLMETFKNSDSGDLTKMLQKLDYEEVMRKLNDVDMKKIKNMPVDKQELKNVLSSPKLNDVLSNSGDDAKKLVEKFKSLLDNN